LLRAVLTKKWVILVEDLGEREEGSRDDRRVVRRWSGCSAVIGPA
jgi:hypothetical protein